MNNTDTLKKLQKIGKGIVIATHPRSGTHLTIDLIRKQFRECQSWLWLGETLHHSYLNLDHLAANHSPHITQQKALEILRRPQRPIIKTHSLPEFAELGIENQDFVNLLMENVDIYYVVRDGRDVLCSVHLWMQQSHPEARCSLSEFMRLQKNGLSYPKIWANHVLSWLDRPQVRLLRFESNIQHTNQVVTQIGREIGLKPLYVKPLLPKRRQIGSRWEDYWLRLTRQSESTTIVGRYRNQKPLKWREVFTYEDRQFFHQEAGELLIRLGYETDESWVERLHHQHPEAIANNLA